MLRDKASLWDVRRAGQNVLNFAKDLEKEDLEIDDIHTSGILYQLVIVGEATKRISSEFRMQHPEVPWSDMAGMRDILAHQYDKLDFDALWDIVQISVPDMLKKIEPLTEDG